MLEDVLKDRLVRRNIHMVCNQAKEKQIRRKKRNQHTIVYIPPNKSNQQKHSTL